MPYPGDDQNEHVTHMAHTPTLPEPCINILANVLTNLPDLTPMQEINLIGAITHAYACGACSINQRKRRGTR